MTPSTPEELYTVLWTPPHNPKRLTNLFWSHVPKTSTTFSRTFFSYACGAESDDYATLQTTQPPMPSKGSCTAALSAEQATQQRMADELRARYEEQEGLVSRLQTAQRVNEEWQERVRSVSAEFEATAADWQAQLTMADGKWRAMVDALRTRLATSEALNSDNAARIQQLSLENETLSGRLRTAQEDAATQRDAAKKAQASEAELAGKLHARDAELAELRGRLSSSTSEGNSHGAKVVELTGRLALVEGELLQAKELNATIPGLKGRLSDAEAALKLTGNRGGELEEALAAALGRCREKENEIAALEAEKEQLVDQLSTEAEELQSELNMAQQSLASTTNELAAEQEVAAEVVAPIALREEAEAGGVLPCVPRDWAPLEAGGALPGVSRDGDLCVMGPNHLRAPGS